MTEAQPLFRAKGGYLELKSQGILYLDREGRSQPCEEGEQGPSPHYPFWGSISVIVLPSPVASFSPVSVKMVAIYPLTFYLKCYLCQAFFLILFISKINFDLLFTMLFQNPRLCIISNNHYYFFFSLLICVP